ncbi:MAG: hypothetical protein CL692_04150 [Cellvibrionales bacterium]|jgi:NAD(P)-dependent dehydrogenase (short-subunit alcohol dehydrogenase family)|nr:hypothetical protein [Cellvibrionales bacterium]MDG2471747.1 SDR family NAD(P)-dependent oxidoreductase [Pseudomonadales bacterium]HCH20583.1 hypothetical protein [Cellvibrionales bacterium]
MSAEPALKNAALSEKVYIVTGGSKGFGYAIADALLARGAKVGLLARGEQGLADATKKLSVQHAQENIFTHRCDVANSEEIRQAFANTKQHFGRLNGLINNAGLARPGSVETLREDEVILQINTNFLGTVLCSQAAIPLLRGEDNPRIINISSASAWHYNEMLHLSIYASVKAAVERFTRDLRLECQEDDIGVTCIRPGAAWTEFAEGWDSERLTAGVEAWAKRFGTVSDSGMDVSHVAESICYALSYPAGVAVDLLEVRPNSIATKEAW